ncbi:MAG: hypothetical protein M1562_00420 [Candidatus Marsarchaeota archaeon]|jgi:hypothetical protein|nr:hypothetical protein [Candidatus Marsarchaeota archaeon]
MPSKRERERDEIWAFRKILSRPNYAVLNLLLQKSPRATKELYSILEKEFTRKTLIIALRELSLELNAIQPTHIRTSNGYGLGYRLNPKLKDIIRSVQKYAKVIESVREA